MKNDDIFLKELVTREMEKEAGRRKAIQILYGFAEEH